MPRDGSLTDFRADRRGAIPQLQGEHRVPLQFLERFLPPLPSAIDGQREPLALERLDQEIGDRSIRRVAFEQIRVGGRDDHGRVRMIPLELRGEPQAVVSRHHDVDDRQVVMMSAQRRQRLIGVGGGLGFAAPAP